MNDDLLNAPSSEQLDALARRQVSALELLDAYLARIDERNHELCAVVTLDAERARETARRADTARASGRLLGPLHGLPVTIKDTLETEGLRTTAGTPELADHVPATDAVVVDRLRRAGAVIMGKTNTPAWAGDYQTTNHVFGRTGNPWNLERSAGGSSGGSAAAVAAGLTSFDIGSDMGGSIRQPAAFCGVFGHKPTHGIVPTTGHLPPRPGDLAPLDINVVGPLARSAADLERVLDIIAGPAPTDEPAWKLALPPDRHDGLASFRAAVWFDDPTDGVDGAVRAVLDTAVGALRADGLTAESADPSDWPVTVGTNERLYQCLAQVAASPGLPDDLYDELVLVARGGGTEPTVHERWARDITSSGRAWRIADEGRHRVRAHWAEVFERYDVVLAPVTPVVAPPHDDRSHDDRRITVDGAERFAFTQMHWTHPANLAGLPATAVPVGTAGGLPVGLQVLGPRHGDRTTLAFARHVERVVGGYRRPPGW
jgi:amidase